MPAVALLCFDVDGTLETGLGPIPVTQLESLLTQGHAVVIVSPSPLRPQGFPEFLSLDRRKNLVEAAKAYPNLWCVYISDNDGDDELASKLGFTYVHPRDFPQFLQSL